jgi:hypothetical protein
MIGLGLNATKNPTVKKTIVRDGLVLRHDYKDRPVEPVSSGAASFTASDNDYITTGADTSLDPAAGSFSISCWVNSNQTGTTGFVVGKGVNYPNNSVLTKTESQELASGKLFTEAE